MALKKIEILSINDNDNPKFINTQAVRVKREDGYEKTWEIVNFRDSVHVLVDNYTTHELIIAKQRRIPVLVNNMENKNQGECFEICAGIVDKNKPLVQIAKEEVLEELGYDIPLCKIKPLRQYCSAVGTQGSTVNTYVALCSEDMKVSDGGGLESEDIEVVRIAYDDVYDFIDGSGKYENIHTDATTLFMLSSWLIHQKVV